MKSCCNEFGIVGTAQQWISSYLDNRSFLVTVDGTYSKDILLQHGLPQGSVIGPLGFVFYTHTVGRIIRHHQLMYHIYADDIQIYLPVDATVPGDVVCGMFKICRYVEDINSWMIRNKLKLNPDKTEVFFIFYFFNFFFHYYFLLCHHLSTELFCMMSASILLMILFLNHLLCAT